MNVPLPATDRPRSIEVASEGHSQSRTADTDASVAEYGSIRRLIWVYFWLLLLEGALRKWIFPQFTNQLLIVRDPVVILIYLLALSKGIFPWNGFVICTAILAFLSALASLGAEHGNHLVTLFGLRTNFLHLPFIFILPKVMDRDDIEKIGKWFFITAVPMALLAVLQFRASPSAWVNVGVGGSEGSQMTVGFGKIRPPGTFSFTSGFALYLGVIVSFVIAWLFRRGTVKPMVAYPALLATGLMVAVSGSRSVLTAVALIMLGAVIVCFRNRAFFGKGMKAVLVIGGGFLLLQFLSVVRQGMVVHDSRITGGGGVRFGLIDRALSGFLEPFTVIGEVPILGQGIGLGTTVAGGLLYGERSFILAETEWLRVVRESGPILGLAFLALRVAITIAIGLRANRALDDDNPLPLILFFSIFPIVLTGQLGIVSSLGFATFGAGLCLAAARLPQASTATELFRVSPESVTNPNRTVRGRSIYAEKLHGR